MTNPLPPDSRPYSSLFRTSEVLKVPVETILNYPVDFPNPHDALTEDILCPVCSTPGNVRLVDPLKIEDTLANAPEAGRAYLWDFPNLKRNKRCSLCRLIWRTFQPFYDALVETGTPHAVFGRKKEDGTEGRGDGEGKGKWIQMIAMVARDTMDNRDISGSGSVYIYEDERIPHFGMNALATDEKQKSIEWRLSRKFEGDSIDFDLLKKWIETCEAQHGSKCAGHAAGNVPAKRLIDVEDGCIVDGSAARKYMTLSYVWGDVSQFMLEKDILSAATQKGFFTSNKRKIPRTIQDAMHVCRQIGIRHLWVDTLCIVQDDDEDKRGEIALMDEIYGRAVAVIICAAGKDAGCGIPALSGGKRELPSYVETIDGQKLITSLAGTTASAKGSTWNTRAWTFQEYILANRLLVFTDTYVFFRCAQSMWRDDMVLSSTGMLPSLPLQMDDSWVSFTLNGIIDRDPMVVWKDYFDRLLAFYLRRNAKYDSDVLLAFSGILKVLSKVLGPFHYGHSERFFGKSFLWEDPHRGVFPRRPEFPSWSWAGWKWSFNYFDEGRSPVGAYGYDMPTEAVPLEFFKLKEGKLEPFFHEEQAQSPEADERVLKHMRPPANALLQNFAEMITRNKDHSHLLAFYSSVATLKIEPVRDEMLDGRQPDVAQAFKVMGHDESRLFDVYLDPKWREKQSDEHEFVVVGLKDCQLVVMLVGQEDGVYYRVSCRLLYCYLSDEKWLAQHPVQKLIIMG